MGETEYSEALKLGKKEYRARIAKGQFPYLPVLDEILSEADIKTEQNMGLVQVPLDFVVGTSTMGRTYSFAANFMPILDEETEFAVKWSNLSDAQMNEGLSRHLSICTGIMCLSALRGSVYSSTSTPFRFLQL